MGSNTLLKNLSNLLGVILLSVVYTTSSANDFKYEHEIKVDRIVDGDTVDVDVNLGFGIWKKSERIRLLGLDTPESRISDPTEKVFGKLASRKMKEYLDQENVTLVLQDYDGGKFGRTLATFMLPNGKTVTQMMIENNYGVAYHGQSKDDIEQAHLDNREILIERGEVDLQTGD